MDTLRKDRWITQFQQEMKSAGVKQKNISWSYDQSNNVKETFLLQEAS